MCAKSFVIRYFIYINLHYLPLSDVFPYSFENRIVFTKSKTNTTTNGSLYVNRFKWLNTGISIPM